MKEKIKVILCGAAGKMGREIAKNIIKADDLELAGAVDLVKSGVDMGTLAGLDTTGVVVSHNLEDALNSSGADVMIDFTSPLTVMANLRCALQHKVAAVVGTTGLSEDDLKSIDDWVKENNTGAIVAPNFALGAVLMMKAAQLCARYMDAVEIIEMHHDEKLDAPSGTACKTASLINDASQYLPPPKQELEKIPGVRGGRVNGIPIHSIRLPGMVAHQEIIFGGEGQILTLRHDAISRDCFMPGLLLAVRKAPENKELIYGIENLLEF